MACLPPKHLYALLQALPRWFEDGLHEDHVTNLVMGVPESQKSTLRDMSVATGMTIGTLHHKLRDGTIERDSCEFRRRSPGTTVEGLSGIFGRILFEPTTCFTALSAQAKALTRKLRAIQAISHDLREPLVPITTHAALWASLQRSYPAVTSPDHLRGGGVLAAACLVYFADEHAELATQLIAQRVLGHRKQYPLVNGQTIGRRAGNSKKFITKVMFLAAVARPRHDYERGFSFEGKIGMWHFVRYLPALRNSRNRPAGTLVATLVNVDAAVYREFVMTRIVPAVRARFSSANKRVVHRHDNATPHGAITNEALVSVSPDE
ncbi:hypothetical protein DYB32_005936 [Aphanomyces invadans]|uniref:Uncharacterized protein n=1 Tax=Aphanomyces invadans TaxID=157072 RepID=A0A418AT80_9STRA|nr:hypothetical protein DYB32_005936 [Aphanomyces invadans]